MGTFERACQHAQPAPRAPVASHNIICTCVHTQSGTLAQRDAHGHTHMAARQYRGEPHARGAAAIGCDRTSTARAADAIAHVQCATAYGEGAMAVATARVHDAWRRARGCGDIGSCRCVSGMCHAHAWRQRFRPKHHIDADAMWSRGANVWRERATRVCMRSAHDEHIGGAIARFHRQCNVTRNPWAISSAGSRSRRAGPRQCPSTIALGLSQARAAAGCHVGPRTQPRVPPAHSPNIRVTRLPAHSVTSVVANKVAIAAIPTRAVDAIAIDAMRGARRARASLRGGRYARRTPRGVVTRRHRIGGAPVREGWRRIKRRHRLASASRSCGASATTCRDRRSDGAHCACEAYNASRRANDVA